MGHLFQFVRETRINFVTEEHVEPRTRSAHSKLQQTIPTLLMVCDKLEAHGQYSIKCLESGLFFLMGRFGVKESTSTVECLITT